MNPRRLAVAAVVTLQCGHDPKAVENYRPSRRPHRTWRFNAATTRRPWRTTGRHDARLVTRASMRPRPEGRGEHASHRRRRAESSSFNAATTRRPWRTRCVRRRATGGFNAATTRRPWRTMRPPRSHCGRSRLQCGHDPKAVENRALERSVHADGFNAATTRRPWRTTTSGQWRSSARASMRPRPEGRGEPSRSAASSAVDMLQCGHDPKAVENA